MQYGVVYSFGNIMHCFLKKEYIIFAKVMEYVSGDNYCDKWWCNLKLLRYYFKTLISNFIFEEDKGFNFI